MPFKFKILAVSIFCFATILKGTHYSIAKNVKYSIAETKVLNIENIPFNEFAARSNTVKYRWPIASDKDLAGFELLVLEELQQVSLPNNTPTNYQHDLRIEKESGQNYLALEILPIRKTSSGNYLLESFEITYDLVDKQAAKPMTKGRSLESSILAAGGWYKLSVDHNGVYKIDESILDSLGISKETIDPRNLRVFSNPGGMLPELAGTPRPEDIIELPLFFEGDRDGVWSIGEKALFYVEGPDKLVYEEQNKMWDFELNLYDRSNYIFFTFDAGVGKRISNYVEPSGASTQVISTFHDFQGHEREIENFLDSGREFYGEAFELDQGQQFSFTFPNVVSGSIAKLSARAAGRSFVNGMSFDFDYEGSQLLRLLIPKTSVDYTAAYARVDSDIDSFTLYDNELILDVNFSKSSSSDKGWLDYIEITGERYLRYTGNQESFCNFDVDSGEISTYAISDANSSLLIWDISRFGSVSNINFMLSGGTATFQHLTDTLAQFYMFTEADVTTPKVEGAIENQNLRAYKDLDYLIISGSEFLTQANAIGQLHQEHDDLSFQVVDQKLIFNEFSGGRQDVSAIRDFIKHVYESSSSKTLKYVLLFGDASYDPLGHEQDVTLNKVMAYESQASIDPVSTYVSDDFFALLDDSEGLNLNSSAAGALDVGIGRFTVSTEAQAEAMVEKVRTYFQNSFGDWRNTVTFVADDEDNNIHINDADVVARTLQFNYPWINLDKIYFDAYPQENAAGGSRYPAVQDAINARIFDGTFIVNYTGHGGEEGWAHERVLNLSDINSWSNKDKLPLFVTATCEFSRYDDPARTSAGEQVLLSAKGGAIALMTTVRLVYSSANQNLATNFYSVVYEKESDGTMPRLGDVVKRAKNNATNGINNRKFTLLGDPALRLNYPKHRVVATTINGNNIITVPDTIISATDTTIQWNDTLKALSKVEICGVVTNEEGRKLADFNGRVYPTIFDKPLSVRTLANDENSNARDFDLQKNVVYSGMTTVENGAFCFEFIVPKDINYNVGFGKISLYAENGIVDGTGNFDSIFVGGTADSFAVDNEGPSIEIFMNDEQFAFGGLTDENPTLILVLKDSSGVNTVGNSIGHDISFSLDESPTRVNLNNFYASDLDSYQSGRVEYPLSGLASGPHTIHAKAWDVYNNSAERSTEFVVAESAELALSHVLNYPNPFSSQTRFFFEHNRPGMDLKLKISIYTISGKVVQVLEKEINSAGYLVNDISWDGLDSYGNKIGNGVYVYSLELTDPSANDKVSKIEKLVILN